MFVLTTSKTLSSKKHKEDYLMKFNLLPKKEKVLSKKGKSLPKLNFLYSLTQ
jgi:hypothetical protein